MTGTCSRHGNVEVGPLGECPVCHDLCVLSDEEAE